MTEIFERVLFGSGLGANRLLKAASASTSWEGVGVSFLEEEPAILCEEEGERNLWKIGKES